MKYNMTFRLFGTYLGSFLRKEKFPSDVRKAIRTEYRNILLRAKDIGADNPLLGSYALAAFFIAMNRAGTNDPEKNCAILSDGMKNSKLTRAFFGDADSYLDEKKLPKRQQWSARTHEKKYENDWVVDVFPGNEEYDLGYDYHECGVCKLCRDENCFELAKYLCRLDFMLVEVIGVRLTRTQVLAEGGEKCDFRFHRT